MIRYILFLFSFTASAFAGLPGSQQPNILFITADDLNWDSVGVYGSPVENITPHIDSLATDGMRFQHAFVNSSACTPSRNVMQTGQYPHNSGVRGFYSVVFPEPTLPEVLRDAGYFTGIAQKVPDSTPTNDFGRYWNYYRKFPTERDRTPAAYGAAFEQIMSGADRANRPFYAVINITDPHLPFYGGPTTQEGNWDQTPPSRIYGPEEVPIPGFLPQEAAFGQEVADYYNSVRRADDCVGAVLDALEARGLREETIIIFLSDHGMSFPFAKSNLYPDGVRTPWIVVWPGISEAGHVDNEHMISTIDLMPTVLEMAGIPAPDSLPGRTLVPLIHGESQSGRDRVFVELNENPNADVRPSRGIYTKDFVYIFSPWSDGERVALFESRWYRSYATFAALAKRNPEIRARFDFLMHRKVEELYKYTSDPHALNDLIDNPQYAGVLDDLRGELADWMERTDDYVLPAFASLEDPAALERFMAKEDAMALERSLDTEWKRWRNRSGTTGGDRDYYDPAVED